MSAYDIPCSLWLHDNMKRHILWIALIMRNINYYRQFLSTQIFLLFLAILYSALELFIKIMVSIPWQFCDNYWNIYAYVIVATGWILWKAIPTHVHMDSCILRSIAWFHTASVLLRSTSSIILSYLLVILLITNEGYLLCIQWGYYLSNYYEMIITDY